MFYGAMGWSAASVLLWYFLINSLTFCTSLNLFPSVKMYRSIQSRNAFVNEMIAKHKIKESAHKDSVHIAPLIKGASGTQTRRYTDSSESR